MAVNIDLSGWSLANGIDFKFASGTIIPAGGFLIVAKNPADASLAGVSGVSSVRLPEIYPTAVKPSICSAAPAA